MESAAIWSVNVAVVVAAYGTAAAIAPVLAACQLIRGLMRPYGGEGLFLGFDGVGKCKHCFSLFLFGLSGGPDRIGDGGRDRGVKGLR